MLLQGDTSLLVCSLLQNTLRVSTGGPGSVEYHFQAQDLAEYTSWYTAFESHINRIRSKKYTDEAEP